MWLRGSLQPATSNSAFDRMMALEGRREISDGQEALDMLRSACHVCSSVHQTASRVKADVLYLQPFDDDSHHESSITGVIMEARFGER